MSVRVMSRVWDHSEQVGGALLLLLALADWADDDGVCWPKQKQLATKARCSIRAVRSQLERLEEAGEIQRTDGRGRSVGSVYRVVVGLSQNGKEEDSASLLSDEKRKIATRKAAIFDVEKGKAATRKEEGRDTPLRKNHQEPSGKPSRTTAAPADAGGAPVRAAARPDAAAPTEPLAEGNGATNDAAIDSDAPVTDQRATFSALCHAAGWSARDLTPGNRAQLGKLAARILEEPGAERPTGDDLVSIYQAELDELSAKVQRRVSNLTVAQFRQAIGAWISRQRAAADDRQHRAAEALRLATFEAERKRQTEAAGTTSPDPAARLCWDRIATALRPRMSPATWNTWLAQARALRLQDGVLTVQVSSDFHVDWISSRLTEPLATLSEEAGLSDLRFVAADAAGEERAA